MSFISIEHFLITFGGNCGKGGKCEKGRNGENNESPPCYVVNHIEKTITPLKSRGNFIESSYGSSAILLSDFKVFFYGGRNKVINPSFVL